MTNDIYLIKWVDISEPQQEWQTIENLKEWAKINPFIVQQVGFLVEQTDEYWLITSQVVDIPDMEVKVGNATRIPTQNILSWIKIDLDEIYPHIIQSMHNEKQPEV